MKLWLNVTGRIVRNDVSVTDSSLLVFEIKSIDFFILLLGFASSILGFPRAQKDTMLDTQANS